MSRNEPVLSVRGARKAYGGVVAVRDVSFDLPHGQVLGLLGPNGAGKTTLVDLITGLQRPDGGEISLGGHPLRGSAAARARQGLGRTFQHPQLIAEMTTLENVMIGRYARRMHTVVGVVARFVAETFAPSTRRRELEWCRQLVDSLELTDPLRPVGDLSLGEQRQVEVARAVATEPTVLLLDEPFAGSDPRSREAIISMIRGAATGERSVVLVDHNVDIVTRVADRIVLMAEGARAYEGPAGEALVSQAMRDVYFSAPGRHGEG